MTYEFHYDRERNVFIVEGHGPATMEDIRAATEGRFHHPDYRQGMWLLMDYSDITPASVNALDVREYQKFTIEIREKYNDDNLVVVVAPHDLLYGLSRMVGTMSESKGYSVNVFRTRAEAFAFIAK